MARMCRSDAERPKVGDSIGDSNGSAADELDPARLAAGNKGAAGHLVIIYERPARSGPLTDRSLQDDREAALEFPPPAPLRDANAGEHPEADGPPSAPSAPLALPAAVDGCRDQVLAQALQLVHSGSPSVRRLDCRTGGKAGGDLGRSGGLFRKRAVPPLFRASGQSCKPPEWNPYLRFEAVELTFASLQRIQELVPRPPRA